PGIPFLFGLAPCGVCPAPAIAGRAVRSYRTFSPLPRQAGAVCFLWHFPSIGLEPNVPDVIRHTAQRSSDFPLSKPRSPGKPGVHGQTATIRSDINYPYYKMKQPPAGLSRSDVVNCKQVAALTLRAKGPPPRGRVKNILAVIRFAVLSSASNYNPAYILE